MAASVRDNFELVHILAVYLSQVYYLARQGHPAFKILENYSPSHIICPYFAKVA